MASAASTDPVRQYLQEIGRVPLLSEQEELLLARQVKRTVTLEQQRGNGDWTGWAKRCGMSERELRQALHWGRRARERMLQSNLRLVVAVAKKYQRRGIDLLDLVQEGTLGLERAVDRFDPARGFRFSTYAFWWIRQGITRAIATQSRTIRLPMHVIEKLNRIRSAQHELAMQLGRMPTLGEIGDALEVEPDWIRATMEALRRPVSLERRVGREQDTELGDLLEDPQSNLDTALLRDSLHADLERLLERLSPREADVIRQRFGFDDDQPRTLTEIGEHLHISRERVRQLEARGLRKLRHPYYRGKVHDYLSTLDH